MSKREKTLISVLTVLALSAGLLLGYKRVYEPRLKRAKNSLRIAEQNTMEAKNKLEMADLIVKEQEWLEEYAPNSATQQAARSSLQEKCEKTAENTTLEIKRQTPLPSAKPENSYYHRARMDILLRGKEINFYKWMSIMDDPTQSRRVTYLRLNPQRDDSANIEAKVIVEQWYAPETEITQ